MLFYEHWLQCVCSLRGHEEHIAVVCASPALSLISQKDCLSHALALSPICKMQALGHYKICTICRNIFQLFTRNNAVDFFTRYISAGAAPGCLGIMSVCIEQKKARVCAPVRPALPDCGFCSWLLLFNLEAMLPLWRVFFYCFSAGINCANNVSPMEMLPLCLFLWIPLWINSLFVDGNVVHRSKMWRFLFIFASFGIDAWNRLLSKINHFNFLCKCPKISIF